MRTIFYAEGISVTESEILAPGDRLLLCDAASICPDDDLFGGMVVDISDLLGTYHRFKFKQDANAIQFMRTVQAANSSVYVTRPLF